MLKRLLMLKIYFNRAMSHIGIPLAIFEKAAILMILLKMFGMDSWYIVSLSVIILFAIIFLIGWLDVRFGIYDVETSLNNNYNPELQKLLRSK